MIEKLSSCTDPICLMTYDVRKEVTDETISVIVNRTSKRGTKEIKRIIYKNIGEEYESPFLNWHSVIFCSGSRDIYQDYDYMNSAVQKGVKTAATIYFAFDSSEGKQYIESLPSECDAVPFGPSMLYAFHKGKLSDFFDFHKVRNLYERHGVNNINWEIVKEYYNLPMEDFGQEEKCRFSLQSGGNREQTIITGLVLGYPIESTIACIGGKFF